MKTELDYGFETNNIWYTNNNREFGVLVGQTIIRVEVYGNEIILETKDYTYKMHHVQDCCEDVNIESIVGDMNDLIGQEILLAEERVNPDGYESKKYESSYRESGYYEDDSWTWTFYTIRCVKCSIDIRWYGSSNGYYSESVDFVRIK